MARASWLALIAAAGFSLATRAHAEGDDLILVPTLEELDAADRLDRGGDDGAPPDELLIQSAAGVGVPLAEAPGIVTVLRASDLRAIGARTLYDALRYTPELDVTRDAFGFYHVAVRGRRVDAEVLVLLDGHRLNDVYDGRIVYELPIAMVDRIEILRGPSSALYGSNAFAGVVSIYTRRRLASTAELQLATSGGDRDELGPGALWLGASTGRQLGQRFELHAALEGAVERGPELLVPEDSLTRNRMDPDTGESQSRSCDNQPTDSCPDSAFTRLPRRLLRANVALDNRRRLLVDGDQLRLGVHALAVDRGPFIGEYDTLTPDSRLRTLRTLGDLTYTLPLRRDGSLSVTTTTAVDVALVDREIQVAPDGFKELVDGVSKPFPDGQLKVVDYIEVVLEQELRLRWRLPGRNSLIVGAEVEHTRMPHFGFRTNYDDAGNPYGELGNYFDFPLVQDGKTRTVLGIYAEELYSAPRGVTLVAGGRFDLYSDFGSAISPRAGAIWRRGALSLKLFYGWAFRAPTFQELYDQTGRIDLGQFVGNPALDASRVRTLEAAALYLLTRDEYLLEVTVTGARSAITDSIDRAPLSGLVNPILNTSDIASTAASVELRLELLNRRLSLFTNGAWQRATADYAYVDPDRGLNIVTSSALVNVPRYRLNAGARVRLGGRYAAGAFAELGSSRRNNERTPLEGQHFFDYSPYAMVQFYGQVENLWNELFLRVAVRNVTNAKVNDEPFRANRMPQGIPRDRARIEVAVGMDF